jgi:hypothetical protein
MKNEAMKRENIFPSFSSQDSQTKITGNLMLTKTNIITLENFCYLKVNY